MNTKKFTYPEKVILQKNIIKITALMPLILIPFIVKNNTFGSLIEGLSAVFFPLLITLSCLLYLGSWADIEVDEEEGIYLFFLWKRFFIPWKNILEIRDFDLGVTRIKIIIVDKRKLNWFYKIYSFFTIGSILPSFHIYPYINDYKELLDILNRKANKINSKK